MYCLAVNKQGQKTAEKDDKKVKNFKWIDPLDGDSQLVLKKWEEKDIGSILDHNVSCLLKEYYILEDKKYLYDKYKDKINERGWYN